MELKEKAVMAQNATTAISVMLKYAYIAGTLPSRASIPNLRMLHRWSRHHPQGGESEHLFEPKMMQIALHPESDQEPVSALQRSKPGTYASLDILSQHTNYDQK